MPNENQNHEFPAPHEERRGDPASSDRPLTTETREFREGTLHILPGHRPPEPLPPLTLPTPREKTAYEKMTAELKTRYKIAIRKWRKSMSGVAYELTYKDGRIKRFITTPKPKSPVSAAIFLHEVGHHAIGFRRYSLRCLEEYYVWQWAFREMTRRHIPIDPRVLRHYRRSMHHYVRMAERHNISIPPELHEFTHNFNSFHSAAVQ